MDRQSLPQDAVFKGPEEVIVQEVLFQTETILFGILAVLAHPEIELHNNPAELGARQRVRKRDVSLQACKAAGLADWDTFQSLVETARKLGVNIYHYLYDRVSGQNKMPSLASLILQKAPDLNLGQSWQSMDTT